MSCLGSPRRPACWILILILIFVSLLVISTPGVGQFSAKATTLNFGNVPVGNSLIQPLTVTNYGKASLTLYQVTVSGSGFRFVGSNLPITLASQETVNLSISFSPPSAASFTGSVTVSAYNSWGNSKNYRYHTATFTLSGTGSSTTPGYLTAPSSLDLGTVMIGHSQTQPLALSNTGASTLTISAIHLTGTGYSVSGLALPYTLAPGASANLSVLFAPTTTGTVTATVNVASDASDASVAVSLTGAGTSSSGTLAVTPGSLSFGSVTIGNTQTQNGSVTANGGSVTLSSTSSSNSAFTLNGLALPMTIASGQSVPFTVTFAPSAAGTVSANVSFFTASSGSASETASGSGVTLQHTVNLSWNASTSTAVSGYNVYRGTSASGPYSKVNSALDPAMNYGDSTVQSGKTYYYVTTAVDSSGVESSYSNQVTAAVPFP